MRSSVDYDGVKLSGKNCSESRTAPLNKTNKKKKKRQAPESFELFLDAIMRIMIIFRCTVREAGPDRAPSPVKR